MVILPHCSSGVVKFHAAAVGSNALKTTMIEKILVLAVLDVEVEVVVKSWRRRSQIRFSDLCMMEL